MQYNIITIERQYASGGREVGERLSQELGVPFYGKEILEMVAKKTGYTVPQLERYEETATGSFLYSLYLIGRATAGEADGLSPTDKITLMEAEIIRDLSNEGKCIFVGRGAGAMLQAREDVLNVFVYADNEYRRQRAIEEYGDEARRVDATLRQYDRRRANFYKAYSRKGWDDKENYHMMLDSGKLGIEGVVKTILSQIEK